jgi:hypothetical protein
MSEEGLEPTAEDRIKCYPKCHLCGALVDVSGGPVSPELKKYGVKPGGIRWKPGNPAKEHPEGVAECYYCIPKKNLGGDNDGRKIQPGW